MTTAPNTLMITSMEPGGKSGVTQPAAAPRQSTLTRVNSYKNEKPMMDTKPMIQRSILA